MHQGKLHSHPMDIEIELFLPETESFIVS